MASIRRSAIASRSPCRPTSRGRADCDRAAGKRGPEQPGGRPGWPIKPLPALAAWLTIVLLAGGLLWATGAPAAAPAGTLTVVDWELSSRIEQVLPLTWQGRQALMVRLGTDDQAPGTPAGPRLRVGAPGAAGFTLLADWSLLPGSRWAEPLRLAGGKQGFLVLIDATWFAVQPMGKELAWTQLCVCDTVYQTNQVSSADRFVYDLDGDGVDELVLPQANGMGLYRVLPGGAWHGPLARLVAVVGWNEQGAPLTREANGPYVVPPYRVVSVQPKEPPVLLVLPAVASAAAGLLEASLKLPAPGRIAVDAAARSRARKLQLPAGLAQTVAALPDRAYADAEAVLTELLHNAPTPDRGDWWPRLTLALAALEDIRAVQAAQPLALPGLPAAQPGDHGFVGALQDMNGDGVPDLLYALVHNEKQILKTSAELRWYRGQAGGGRLTFPGPAQVLTSDGPAVAALMEGRVRPPARDYLVVARTQISLMALLEALSSKKATLDTAVYPFTGQGLGAQPSGQAQLTFNEFSDGTAVLLFSADLDGDGTRELLMNLRPDELSVFANGPQGPDLAAAPVLKMQSPLPAHPEEGLVRDWLGRGREELLMWYHASRYPDSLRRTLRLVYLAP